MVPDDSAYSFEFWAGLAAQDPASFEQARCQLIEHLIASASVAAQPRLRGLQWQVDRLREVHSPLSACVRISGMMWERLLGSNGLLDAVDRFSRAEKTSPPPMSTCQILPFERPPKAGDVRRP
jgi:hypothetical protein